MDSIKKILSAIDEAIAGFQESVPGTQKKIFEELQPMLKELEIKDGRILNNIKNLKLIGSIKNKLEKVILSPDYKKTVEKFLEGFTAVTNLNNEYFAQFNNKYKPSKTLPIIKELTIDKTIQDLVGRGLQSSVVDPVRTILVQNVTTGGSYADFMETVREHILQTESPGSLERYTKQITTDAINQYNAQYHDAIAQDLQFNWGRYVGSNITTSREFCILLTAQQWVHRSQLPEVIKGHIGTVKCKLSNTTGLPLGMIPETNEANFKVLRGGYNCGHQFFWVPDNAVPENIRKALDPSNPGEAAPESKPKFSSEIAQKVFDKNKPALKGLEDRGFSVSDELLEKLGGEISIKSSKRREAHFDPSSQEIVIGDFTGNPSDRTASKYFMESVMPHEIGHAIHNTRGIIANGKVSKEFAKHYEDLQNIVRGKESDIEDLILAKREGISQNDREQLGVIADILGSLTQGNFGYGHSTSYYKYKTASESEIFAHGVSLATVSNQFTDLTPEMKKVIEKMIEYSKGL